MLAALLAMTMVAALAPFISTPYADSFSRSDASSASSTSSSTDASAASAEALLRDQLERVGDGLTLQTSSYSSLDARFMLAGPVFESRTDQVFSLATTKFMGEPLLAAEPTRDGDRIVYEQAGLTEWWVAEGSSFEQGWTVAQAPANGETSITLEVGLAGAVAQMLSPTDAVLIAEDGSQVSYRDLHAFDANGTPLAASLATDGGTITITVNADGALYPVTIDPVIGEDQRILGPDYASGDRFGESVATFGNLLAVSAREADYRFGDLPGLGRVDIFEWDGAAWLYQDSVGEEIFDNDDLGYDLAINAGTLVVGAPDNDNNGTNAGVVMVYTFDGATDWSFKQEIYECDAVPGAPCGQAAAGGFTGNRFGHSVAISDSDRIIVGAPGAATDTGRAFVYDPDPAAGNAWQTRDEDKLASVLATAAVAGDRFGTAVDISPDGTWAIVGSPGTTEAGQSESGRATLFSENAGNWSFADFDAGPSRNVGQENGASVAIGIDSLGTPIVVIGRPFRTRENPTDTGASGVRVLSVTGGVMTPVSLGDVSSPSASDGFGFSVDFDNDTVLVGAPFNNGFPPSPRGIVYAYTYDVAIGAMDNGGAGASAASLALPSDWPTATGDDTYGFAVAVSPTSGQLIVGSPGHDQPVNGRSGINAGEVSFFQPGGPTTNITSGDLGSRNNDQLGRSIAVSGNRMAIGAARDDEAGPGLGAVLLYTRADADSPWTFESAVSYPEAAVDKPNGFGNSIDMEGDWMAIGSSGANRVDIYRHTGSWGLEQTLFGAVGEDFGIDVAITAGGELLYVGVPGDDTCGTNCGAVRQYENSGTFVLNETITPSLGGAAGDEFGRTLDVDYIPGAATDVRLVVGSAAPGIEAWTQPTANGSTATIEGFAGSVPADSVAIDGNRMVFGSISQNPNSLVVVDVNEVGDLAEREIYNGNLYDGNFADPVGFVDVSGDVVVAGFDNTGGSVGIFYNDPTYGWGFSDTGTRWTPTGEADELRPGSIGTFDRLGTSVAIDGLSIVAGVPGDDALATLSGGAFALEYVPAVLPAPTNKLTNQYIGQLGFADKVIIHGELAVAVNKQLSRVYYYRLVAGSWVFQNTLSVTPPLPVADFDFSADGKLGILYSSGDVQFFTFDCTGPVCFPVVTGNANTVANGTPTSIALSPTTTDAFVTKSDSATEPLEHLDTSGFSFPAGIPADFDVADNFGSDIAVAGDFVYIGASGWDSAGNDNAGLVYVYSISGSSFVGTIGRPAGETGENFGDAVDVSDDWVVVGHPFGVGPVFGNPVNTAGTGLVHVFDNAVGYPLDQTLASVFSDTADRFGDDVSIDGDIIVVGAPAKQFEGIVYRGGAAFSFNYDSVDWNESDSYQASDNAAGDFLGTSVSISGLNVLVNAPGDDNPNGLNAGALYFYDATPAAPVVNDDPALAFDLALGAGQNGQVTVAPSGVAVSEFNPELLEEAADDGTSIAAAPFASTDVAGTTLQDIPISSLPISSLAVNPDSPLSSIPVVELGLDYPGGWPGLFADSPGSNLDDIPINDIKLSDVFAAGEPAGTTLASLPISSLDVGGTPISSLPISSLYLGSLNLDEISSDVAWCTILADFVDGTCNPANISLFEATISGVPISSLPISSLPISSLPISSLPISSLPISSLNLAASPISSLPISSLPISSLPISSLPISSLPISSLDLSGTPISSLPISSLELSNTPISSLPISSLPISSLKLRNVPISSLPISSLPISSLPISSLPISSLFLADVPISSLPISSLSGYDNWCDYLADLNLGYDCSYATTETAFLANTSIADLGLRGIPISSLPISSLPISSLPISSLPISSLPISSLPISSLPISSLPISSLDLAGTPISSLTVNAATLADVPISSLDVAGSPISSLPISSLPISSLPISSLPISSLPISSLPISSLTVAGAPISSLQLNGSPISSLPISSLDLADTPISSLPISSLPISSLGIDCDLVDCGVDTLLDAVQAGAVNPANVSLGDLQPFLGNIRLSDIADHILTATRQDVVDAVAANTTPFGDLDSYANLTLGELPLTDALVANLTLAQLNDALWSVRLSDLVGALIDPSTGQPFADSAVTGTLEDFRDGAGQISDLLHFGDMTFDEFFANGTGTVTFGDLGPLLALIHTDVTTDISNGAGNFGNSELGGLTLADLLGIPSFDGITLEELFDAANTNDALEGFDIADFLLLLLGVDAVPFSDLDFTEVSTGQLPPTVVPAVTFAAPFEVTNTDVERPVEVSIQIPGTASYAPNSATVEGPPGVVVPVEPVVDGNTLTWTFPGIESDVQYAVNFAVTPTVTLGSTNLSGTARIVGTEVSASAVNVVSVLEPLEPNDFPAATSVSENTVYLTYISSETDNDVFSISLADNDEIAVQLSSLSADLDFALYVRPTDAGVGAALSGTSDAAAIQPIINPDQVGTTSEPVDDFRRLDEEDPSLELIGVSNAPGNETELLVAEALPAGTYFVQVFGANGATNTDPAALQIQVTAAEVRPACSNVGTVTGTRGSAPAGGETPNTIFLVNTQRMEHFYGQDGLDAITAVNNFAAYLNGAGASLGIDPLVISVDGFNGIDSAYDQWEADINCTPESANAVVAAIGDMLDTQGYRANLEHIVVVGGDPIVPMARLLDATEVANEYDFRHEFLGDNLLGAANNINSLSASFWDSVYLSDEPYGETSAQDLGNRFLYVSDVALGRLVETPDEITGMLSHFQTFNGQLDATSAAVLGYDFLVDSSQEIAADLAAAGLTVDDSLADGLNAALEKWTRVDAEGKVIPAGGAPDLISLNGHFDHYRALPADGDKVPNFSDNFLSDTVLNATDGLLTSSIVFSMGCHSGLSVSDLQIGNGANNNNGDWAQTFASDQAIFIGNTGFGYGDTEAVAYSERLMALFAEGAVRPTALPSGGQTTIGQALTFAKNSYASDLSVFSVYDEKALMEMTFYGLPFYTVDLSPAPAAPVPTNVTAPDSTNLETLGLNTQTSNNADNTDRGVVYSNPDANGDPQNIVSPGRPIQPSQSVDVSVVDPADSTQLGQVAHGALILNMDSTYVSPVDPVIAAVVFNEADDAPEPPVGDVVFPSKPVKVNTTTTPGGDRQTLVLATGQFNSEGNTQRLDNNINTVVYYSDPSDTDFKAPKIGVVESTLDAGTGQLTVTLNATDADGSVARVYIVAVGDPGTGSRTWTGVDLAQTAGSSQWSGSITVPGSPNTVKFLVQAVDSSGNVGFATNKARNFDDDGTVTVDPPSPDLATTVNGPLNGGTGWYTGNATVAVTLPAELTATYSVTPGVSNAPLTGSSFPINGNGTFTWQVTASDGQTNSGTVRIDSVAPTASLLPPENNASYLASEVPNVGFLCTDPSLQSCVATATPNGGSAVTLANGDPLPNAVGTYNVSVTASDIFGNNSSATATYTVTADPLQPLTAVASTDNLFPGTTIYTDDVEVTVDGDGAPTNYQLDGGAAIPVPASGKFTVTTEGVTIVTVNRPAGGAPISLIIEIDRLAPEVAIAVPVDAAEFEVSAVPNVEFSCADANLDTCVADVDGTAILDGDQLPSVVGSHVVTATGTDELGRVTTVSSTYTVVADPLTDLAVTISDDNLFPGGTLYTGDVVVTVDSDGSPTEYSLNGGTPIAVVGGEFTITADGQTDFIVTRTADAQSVSGSVTIDTTAPEVVLTTPVDGDVYDPQTAVNISFACTDANLDTCVADVDGTPILDGDPLPSVVGGPYVVTVTGTDAVGLETTVTASYSVEAGALSAIASTDNLFPGTTLYTDNVEVTVDSGGAATEYTLNGGTAIPVPASGVFTVSAEGETTVVVSRPVDGESVELTIEIDRIEPVVTLTTPADGDEFTAGAVPNISFLCTDANLLTCEADVDGGAIADGAALPGDVGPHVVTVTGTDAVGLLTTTTVSYTVVAGGEGVAFGDVDIDGVALPGQAVDIWGEFTGGVGPYSVSVDWGNGSSCPGSGTCVLTAPSAGEPGMIDASFTYPAGGAFDVVVTVTDSTGGVSSVTLSTATCTIVGDNRNNFLRGTSNDDVICGLGGNDRIFGRGGNDLIYGGSGSDRIYGEAGDDVIYGGRGSDYIVGSGGNDVLIGGKGNDDLFGGSGDDILKGRLNNDRLFGSSGNDTLIGNRGNDKLYGGTGNDDLQGRRGNDSLFGQNGDDTISGGQGSDLVYGGNDNDTINGDAGDDNLNGGRGNDSLSGDDGWDRCRGNSGSDTIDASCER